MGTQGSPRVDQPIIRLWRQKRVIKFTIRLFLQLCMRFISARRCNTACAARDLPMRGKSDPTSLEADPAFLPYNRPTLRSRCGAAVPDSFRPPATLSVLVQTPPNCLHVLIFLRCPPAQVHPELSCLNRVRTCPRIRLTSSPAEHAPQKPRGPPQLMPTPPSPPTAALHYLNDPPASPRHPPTRTAGRMSTRGSEWILKMRVR